MSFPPSLYPNIVAIRQQEHHADQDRRHHADGAVRQAPALAPLAQEDDNQVADERQLVMWIS